MITVMEYRLRLLAGSVLALVSTAALVMAMDGLALGDTEKWLARAAGVALQVCLYLFARGSAGEKRLALVLLLVSVAATAAFMEYTWRQQQQATQQRQQVETASSWAVQQLQREVDELNRDIAMRLSLSERDTGSRYQTRGENRLDDELPGLKRQRDGKVADLQRLTVAPPAPPAGTVDAALADAPAPLRWAVFLGLALLLDGCAIMALATPRPQRPETAVSTGETAAEQGETDGETGGETVAEPVAAAMPAAPLAETTEDDPVQRVAQRIRAGHYGQQPVVRKILKEESIRHPVMKQVIELLMNEGALVKQGQKYQLVEVV